MSGIEIAGLVLGALPILFTALDAYKRDSSRLKSGFRKREHVKKLARALRMQAQILDALIKNILLQSGCDLPPDPTELHSALSQRSIRETVDDHLGPKNVLVLTEALEDCLGCLRGTTAKVAGLVPSLKNNPTIQEILDTNDAIKKGQIAFLARLLSIVSLGDLEREIEALDKSSNTLDRLANRITANSQLAQSMPSGRAVQLARTLRAVRQNAEFLHATLADLWSRPCHDQHELKIFLEDRVNQTRQRKSHNACSFQVIFSSNHPPSSPMWHETTVHAAGQDENDDLVSSRQTGVQIIRPPTTLRDPRIKAVSNICSTIQDAVCRQDHPVFHLSKKNPMAVSFLSRAADHQYRRVGSVTFKDVLDNTTKRRGPLPWKTRMELALKLASSFLQFLRTPWMQTHWYANKVHFLRTDGQSAQPDLSRPYLLTVFDPSHSTTSTSPTQTPVKTDLIELGILLLEIWHEQTLEEHFSDPATTTPSNYRHFQALQWLDDVQNPLPDLYHRAVSHCVVQIYTTEMRALEWDDTLFWKAVCENVIDPLSKVAKI